MPRATQMVKQACDACRRRKVKCNAQRPCTQCRSASLTCRTSLVRQKKGRQGRTANVLTELRTKLAEDLNKPASPTDVNQVPVSQMVAIGSGRCHFTRTEHLVSRELLRDCSEYFFARMQGTVPILHKDTFQRYVDQMDTYIHAYCLVASFCAFVMMQTGYSSCQAGEQWAQSMVNGRALLEEATEARKHLDPLTVPVRPSITIAFLLYGCHIALGNQRHAYYFLREATTLYTAGMLDSQSGALEGDDEHPSMAGKLFWLLVISERAHAIRRHRPVTLQITVNSPSLDEASALDAASIGFRCLADLYRPFDESFLGLWNGTHTTCSPESLIQLDEHIRNAVPADLELPDILMADLRVSQQWLRTMIWQLSTTAGFLSSKATHPCMEFRYPLEIARDLSMATWKLSSQSMETHGIGLIEKIFEVACTLTDVMACLSAAGLRSSAFKLGPQDYLKHFFSLIHNLPGGRQRFLPLLLTKIGQTLPSMLESITQHLNLPATAMDAPLSSDKTSEVFADLWPDDQSYSGFNYAEMSRIGDKTPEIDEAFMQYLSSAS